MYRKNNRGETVKKFFKEFGAFVARGNVLDLAVGLVIGAAFQAIIKSMVNDIIMPVIGLISGKSFSDLFWVMKGNDPVYLAGQYVFEEGSVVMWYGRFLQAIIDFLIIALAIFLALKVIMSLKTKLDAAKQKLVANAETEEKPE
jgi:large conductance mechanosensitive channel